MLIDDNEIKEFIAETLDEIAKEELKVHHHKCRHCGCPVSFPVVARSKDIERFQLLIQSANEVMDRYGITGNLLAEIKASCLLEIARRKSKEG